MKCLTDEQLQRLIDMEVGAHKMQTLETHLVNCVVCQKRLAEQKSLIETLNNCLQNGNDIPVPEFRISEKTTRHVRKLQLPPWLKAVAVLIQVLIIWKFVVSDKHQHSLENSDTISRVITKKTFHDNCETYAVAISDVIYTDEK